MGREITASQAGDNNFIAASNVTKTLNVTSTAIDFLDGQDIIIAPNPVTSDLKVTLENPDTKSTIGIYTLGGVQLYNQKVVNKITIISMSKSLAGMYIIKVISQEGVIVKQFIKL